MSGRVLRPVPKLADPIDVRDWNEQIRRMFTQPLSIPIEQIDGLTENVQDIVGAFVSDTPSVTWEYDDVAGTLEATAHLVGTDINWCSGGEPLEIPCDIYQIKNEPEHRLLDFDPVYERSTEEQDAYFTRINKEYANARAVRRNCVRKYTTPVYAARFIKTDTTPDEKWACIYDAFNTPHLQIGYSDWTVCAWVNVRTVYDFAIFGSIQYWTGSPYVYSGFVFGSRYDGSSGRYQWMCQVGRDNGSESGYQHIHPAIVHTGWTFVAWTHTGGTIKFYQKQGNSMVLLDTVVCGSTYDEHADLPDVNAMFGGAYQHTSSGGFTDFINYANCDYADIDEFRLYSKCLSQSDLETLIYKYITTDEEGLMIGVHFDADNYSVGSSGGYEEELVSGTSLIWEKFKLESGYYRKNTGSWVWSDFPYDVGVIPRPTEYAVVEHTIWESAGSANYLRDGDIIFGNSDSDVHIRAAELFIEVGNNVVRTGDSGMQFPSGSLFIMSEDDSYYGMSLSLDGVLTANRNLKFNLNNADRIVNLGASLTIPADPNADRILFWDDSETLTAWLTISTGLQTSGVNLTTKDSEIVHDNLSGFVADEHVAHTGVTLTAGNGLTGGGDISANRTFDVGAGTGIAVAADTVSLSHLGIESLTDPNADRIMFWDDSAGVVQWLTLGTGLSITDTTINASGGTESDTLQTVCARGNAYTGYIDIYGLNILTDKLITCYTFTDEGINAVIDAGETTGFHAHLPVGTYVLDHSITIDNSFTQLQGGGKATLLDGNGWSGNAISIASKTDCTLRDFIVKGNSGGGASTYCISVSGAPRTHFSNIGIQNADANGVLLDSSPGSTFVHAVATGCDNAGFDIDSASYYATLLGCVATTNGIGVYNYPNFVSIIGGGFYANTYYGIYSESSGAAIIGTQLYNNGYYGYYGTGSLNTITGNVFYENRNAVYLGAGATSDAIVGNVDYKSDQHQYSLAGIAHAIVGNTFAEGTNSYNQINCSGLTYAVISGNSCSAGTSNAEVGVALANCDYNVIIGNMCKAHDTFGITLDANSTNNIVFGNQLDGEDSAKRIQNLGSNNIVCDFKTGTMMVECNCGWLATTLWSSSIKSGATQGGAGASAGELWKTASHATLPDNVVLIGV